MPCLFEVQTLILTAVYLRKPATSASYKEIQLIQINDLSRVNRSWLIHQICFEAALSQLY